jgi:hypothetical protein
MVARQATDWHSGGAALLFSGLAPPERCKRPFLLVRIYLAAVCV